ncbi:hypothetical protein REPUB_Repub12eG0067300 [Reevesia pubescens]
MVDFEDDEDIKRNGFLRMKVSFKVDEPLKMRFNLKRQNKPTLGVFLTTSVSRTSVTIVDGSDIQQQIAMTNMM